MSKKKPVTEYETIVKKIGNSARIVAFKSHIGRVAQVKILPDKRDNE
jgi:putative transposon-encoded protein